MRCVEVAGPGGAERLRVGERPEPVPGEGEIAIRISHAGVNRPDILQREGAYPPPSNASDLLGLEASGAVCAIGPGAKRWSVGDRVTALLPGGGYAEVALTRWDHALPMPGPLGAAESAGIPETFFTVWANLFERAGFGEGEWVLIHGGASGIGTTAIQLARAFGAHTVVTAGSGEKCRRCKELGADVVVDYTREDFVVAARDATDGRGVDVILDMVGGDYVERNIRAAALNGRIANIAFLKGSRVTVDLAPAMMKRLKWSGSTLRARPDTEKATLAATLEQQVWPLLERGTVRPVIDSVFPLEAAAEAHRRMESSEHFGKIVLEVNPLDG